MYKSTKVLMLLAVLIFSASSVFAQASADALVEINVKKALSISNLDGNLDFGDVIVGSSGNEIKTPEQGVRFLVSGHNTGNVTLTYGNATLTETGGSTATLTFIPNVMSTAGNNTYTSPVVASTGSSPAMTDDGTSTGTGELYLWLGGSINVDGAAQGDYGGTFTLSVAY